MYIIASTKQRKAPKPELAVIDTNSLAYVESKMGVYGSYTTDRNKALRFRDSREAVRVADELTVNYGWLHFIFSVSDILVPDLIERAKNL